MSQYPPPMTPPPPGYPGATYSLQPPPRRTSAAAVTSLICGIVGCVPFVSQLLAIIFGIVGIRATRRPNVGGRGLAIAGLILGLIGLLGWGTLVGAGGFMYKHSGPARTVARQYLQDVSAGNLQAAQANSASGVTLETIQDQADKMKPLGTFQDVSFFSVNIAANAGQPTRTTLGGLAKFSSGPKGVIVVVVKEGTAQRVESVEFK